MGEVYLDVVDSYDYNFAYYTRNHPLSQMGEFRLLVAILEQALLDLSPRGGESSKKYTPLIKQDAISWVDSYRADHLYSFEGICNILGLEPGFVRKGIHARFRSSSRRSSFRRMLNCGPREDE